MFFRWLKFGATRPVRYRSVGTALALLALVSGCLVGVQASEDNLRIDPVNDVKDDKDDIRVKGIYEAGAILYMIKGSNTSLPLRQWKIDDNQGSSRFEVPGLPEVEFQALAGDATALYVGTGSGTVYKCSLGQSPAAEVWLNLRESVGYAPPISALFWDDRRHRLWIATRNGEVFHWDGGPEHPQKADMTIQAEIISIHGPDGILWVGTNDGVYKWVKDSGEKPSNPVFLPGTRVRAVYETPDKVLWMGTRQDVLYRSQGDSTSPPEHILLSQQPGDYVNQIRSLYGDTHRLWVGTEQGLLKIEGLDSDWRSGDNVEFQTDLSKIKSPNDSFQLEWKVKDHQWRTTPELLHADQEVIVKDADGNIAKRGGEVQFDARAHVYSIKVAALAPGTYRLEIWARDLVHREKKQIAAGRFQVGTPLDIFLWYAKYSTILGGVAYGLLFVGLVIAARWSRGALEVLTDSRLSKLYFYFGYALQYSTFLRLWVFVHYYRWGKKEFENAPSYLDTSIYRADHSSFPATQVFDKLRKYPHILIRGRSGTGKTVLIKKLMQVYFSYPTLKAAWADFGFIPIVIFVRDVEAKPVPALAAAALKRGGIPLEADTTFQKLLEKGRFLLIFDGLNEGGLDKEIIAFSETGSVLMLMTSQTLLDVSSVRRYELPEFTKPFTERLLRFKLGADKGARVAEELGAGLLGDIKSGYDVDLIVDIVNKNDGLPAAERRPLPHHRLELYRETVDFAYRLEKDFPQAALCEKAWQLWKSRRRVFDADDTLTKELLLPLVEAAVVVERDQKCEFRHDQMRDYLAACWAVKHVGPGGTIRRLEDQQIWQLSPQEQRNVFQFLTEMILSPEESGANQKGKPPGPEDLRPLFEFATADVKVRSELFDAAQKAADKRGWKINLSVS
jgi:hypothetical protein